MDTSERSPDLLDQFFKSESSATLTEGGEDEIDVLPSDEVPAAKPRRSVPPPAPSSRGTIPPALRSGVPGTARTSAPPPPPSLRRSLAPSAPALNASGSLPP